MKGKPTQKNYKDLMRLYKEKIRRAEAQLEHNLAIVIKDIKRFCGGLGSIRSRVGLNDLRILLEPKLF